VANRNYDKTVTQQAVASGCDGDSCVIKWPFALKWAAQNVTSCTIAGPGISGAQGLSLSGKFSVPEIAAGKYMYTLSCAGKGRTAKKDITIQVVR
jgi:hypothetical protein